MMMKPETELLLFKLIDVADFSITGPMPMGRKCAYPALARTSVVHARSGTLELNVLSESCSDSRLASTAPFLFEQTNYQFNLAIHIVSEPRPRLLLRGIDLLAERRQIGTQHAYSIPVNFQSEVGYTDVELWLGTDRLFTLHLEVFPTKLDYRTDLLELRADLQMEVRSLVFELYGRTFQMLHRGIKTRPRDIDWLTLLRGEFGKLIHALEIIGRSPLQRVEVDHGTDRFLRPARPSNVIRNYLRKNASKCVAVKVGHFTAIGRSWLSPQLPRVNKRLTPDTPENRFVASAISRMRARLRRMVTQLNDRAGLCSCSHS